jgi:hypothetical protein
MQQPYEREVTVYADITEVRMETRAANYKKLIAEGWVMLGAYPVTMVGDEARGRSPGSNQSSSLRTPSGCAPPGWLCHGKETGIVNHGDSLLSWLIIITMMANTAYGR